jgi:hypothetical protein
LADKADKVQTSVRIPVDLRRRVDDRLHQLRYTAERTSFEGAIHQALELWLSGEPAPVQDAPKPAGPEIPRHMKHLVEWFLDFFGTKGTASDEALKSSIQSLAAQWAKAKKKEERK